MRYNDYAGQRELVAENLVTGVCVDLSKYLQELKTERKSVRGGERGREGGGEGREGGGREEEREREGRRRRRGRWTGQFLIIMQQLISLPPPHPPSLPPSSI